MSIVEYDFRTMTEKDLFKARLSAKEIDFGFIPKWRRRKFVKFCKDNKLVIPCATGFANYVYTANSTFQYRLTQSTNTLFEWFADLTNLRKSWKTQIHTINISPNTQPKSRLAVNVNFNWIVCTNDIIF